ncbi:MAG: hypothetical protein R3B48_25505 [Kofleriaceae bacterium]
MATPRVSVIAVVAGGTVVAAIAAYYFLFVFAKNERLKVARAQAEQWELSWDEARSCLVGDEPLAADLGEALLARALVSSTYDPNACATSIGKLSRPPGNDTGIPAAEAAWEQLETVAKQVAQAYVTFQRDVTRGTALGQGLTRLRDARAALRRASELPLDEAPAGPELKELALSPVLVEGKRVTEFVGSRRGAALIGRASVEDEWYAVEGRAQQGAFALQGRRVSSAVTVANPRATWGAKAGFEERKREMLVQVLVGDLAETGDTLQDKPLTAERALILGAALDAPAARALVYLSATGIFATVSQDQGASWRATALAPTSNGNVFPGDELIDVVWHQREDPGAEAPPPDEELDESRPGAVSWQRLTAAGLPALGAVQTQEGVRFIQACAAPTAPWALVRGGSRLGLVRMDATGRMIPLGDEDLSSFAACDDDGVLLTNRRFDAWVGCRERICEALDVPPREGFGAIVQGEPTVVQTMLRLAAVRAGRETSLLRLPAGAELYALHVLDGGALLFVRQADGTLAVAPLP